MRRSPLYLYLLPALLASSSEAYLIGMIPPSIPQPHHIDISPHISHLSQALSPPSWLSSPTTTTISPLQPRHTNHNHNLSVGSIAGIAVGVALLVVIMSAVVAYGLSQRIRRRKQTMEAKREAEAAAAEGRDVDMGRRPDGDAKGGGFDLRPAVEVEVESEVPEEWQSARSALSGRTGSDRGDGDGDGGLAADGGSEWCRRMGSSS
ncbi:Uu.00g105190.m01.CDS01 [Anthostomella pinea]|uniref:Uu.00g105190.m01.CDS01 n=1 Tax=Anthostomella pinea TaxID=933095 RepID=A0AAI8V8T4_9PEZI|nr:Uu.00g105190.m01.CDS01 [Anthostomella pinea]